MCQNQETPYVRQGNTKVYDLYGPGTFFNSYIISNLLEKGTLNTCRLEHAFLSNSSPICNKREHLQINQIDSGEPL